MRATAIDNSISTEYVTARDGGAGLLDLSSRGRILVSGSEAVMFLNGFITNDMKTLAPNSWMPAAFPNVQGRLLAVVRILNLEDGFLIDTEAATRQRVVQLLDRFTLAGDFRVADLTNQISCFSVQGRNAATLASKLLDSPSEVSRDQVCKAKINQFDVTIIRATHTGEDGFDLFTDVGVAAALRQELINAGAETLSKATAEILRIEAGIASYGVDMDESTIVTETNLDDAVSFTKGCYVGQEIIVRIKHRGHVAKKITGITFDQRVNVQNGAKIIAVDGKEIGRITSATFSPGLHQTIALGYVKYDYLTPGTELVISGFNGIVADLPFVRGSWYQSDKV